MAGETARSAGPYKGTLVAHTHWDRAWYLPFQQFRMRLVRLIDRLLDILDTDPTFRCFTLDAQMVVLEDYLEIRPERRGDIERHVREGRLLVGPWYVLADEYLVSPEALIRNLERGMREARGFGPVMRVGYTPDSFGHIGQLPQIISGFGIDSAAFWRGVGDLARELGSEFLWEAPDGTQVLAVWLPGAGYGQFNHVGYPARSNPYDVPFRVDRALQQLRKGMDDLTPFANTSFLLLMVGVDHEEVNPHLPAIVEAWNERHQDVQIHMGSLPEHVEAVRGAGRDFGTYHGELRAATFSFALQQVYSARMYLKQHNTRCQTVLERYAEPFTAFASLLGADDQRAFLDYAWRELLKNHPHDDICGCSVDPVHRQMMQRFAEVEQVGEVLGRDALRFLTWRVATDEDKGIPLFAINPNSRPYTGTVTTTLAFPPRRGAMEAFSIRDGDGRVIPHQVLGRRVERQEEINLGRNMTMVDVALALPEVPACGYRTLFAGPPEEPPAGALTRSDISMENEYLQVTAYNNGTLRVIDRQTGRAFRGLHVIEDTEDAGDEYTYSPARESMTVNSAEVRVEIEPLAAGPVRAGLRLHYHLALPVALAPDRQRRSEETVDYVVTTDVSLGANDRRLEFVTRLNNTVQDHRLRVLFPTGIQSERVAVDGHFDVLERPVALPTAEGWKEPPSPTAHQRAFVDVSDGEAGITVLNRGLPEYEAIPGPEGVSIALTLLRCVGWLSRNDMLTRPGHAGPPLPTPEAQCLGPHEFHYALQPHAGGWEAIIHDAHAFVSPCVVVTDRTTEGTHPGDIGATDWEPLPRGPELDLLPPEGAFVSLEPKELVLSAVRLSGDGKGLVVRCYNPADRAVQGRLRLLWPVQRASLTDLLEEPQGDLPIDGRAVAFEAGAKKVVTVRCEVAAPGQ